MKFTSDPWLMIELVVKTFCSNCNANKKYPHQPILISPWVYNKSILVKAVKLPYVQHTRVHIPFTDAITRNLWNSLRTFIRDVQQFMTINNQNMCLKSSVYLKAIVEKLPLFFDFPNFQKKTKQFKIQQIKEFMF